jgi:hypothetical protein
VGNAAAAGAEAFVLTNHVPGRLPPTRGVRGSSWGRSPSSVVRSDARLSSGESSSTTLMFFQSGFRRQICFANGRFRYLIVDGYVSARPRRRPTPWTAPGTTIPDDQRDDIARGLAASAALQVKQSMGDEITPTAR